MRSWFSSSTTIINLTIKTTDGALEEQIEIESNSSVDKLKDLIDTKFKCKHSSQKLVFHGTTLEDTKLLSFYKIVDKSILLLMNKNDDHTPSKSNEPQQDSQPRDMFDNTNPYYQSQSNLSNDPVTESVDKNKNDDDKSSSLSNISNQVTSIMSQLAQYHPQLPMAVMEHSKSIGSLITNLDDNQQQQQHLIHKKDDKEEKQSDSMSQEDRRNLAAYYYYLSLASLSAVTSTVASSVYQHLPSKESIATLGSSVSAMLRRSNDNSPDNELNANDVRPSTSWIKHLQKLMTNSKAEKQ
eukprot:169189_1